MKWSLVVRAFAVAGMLLVSVLSQTVNARSTAEEAKVMVRKAVAYLKANGPDKAFEAFTDRSNKDFHDGDLYVFVRTMDGNTIAHGSNPVMIGQTDLHMVDLDGKSYNKEIIELAKTADVGWVHYRWPNPADKKAELKSTYIERVGNYIVCAGFYEN